MAELSVQLFGKILISRDHHEVVNIDSHKALELFCYLLLNRDRPHHRETLAELLWGDCSNARSKKYLRQTLWQLQAAINTQENDGDMPVVLADPDWVQINRAAELHLDVALLEEAFRQVQAVRGVVLEVQSVNMVRKAVDGYKGDLLEGWYQDWCIFERERCQIINLALLDKLVSHYEERGNFGIGLEYGTRMLRFDRARERTHRRLMRLFYLTGDRTAALRQFDRCVSALREELGVGPSRSTVVLYKCIQADDLGGDPAVNLAETGHLPESAKSPLVDVLNRLNQLRSMLTDAQRTVQEDIQEVERVLHRS
jgi:DNA-binding SARP family transcriptional activator